MNAAQIVRAELERYMAAEQEAASLSTRDLEERIRIWRWGKWALLGEGSGQGIKRQLKFNPRNKSEMSEWQSIAPLDDDDAMIVDAAIAMLGAEDRRMLKDLYVYWRSVRQVSVSMRIRAPRLQERRDMALAFVCGHIMQKNA